MQPKLQGIVLAGLFALFAIVPGAHMAGHGCCEGDAGEDGVCADGDAHGGEEHDRDPAAPAHRDGGHEPERCGLCQASVTPWLAAAPAAAVVPVAPAVAGRFGSPPTVAASAPRLQPGARAPPNAC